jgi:polynucleotide 5'-hydroxyl-kinase GRC3/NOL9
MYVFTAYILVGLSLILGQVTESDDDPLGRPLLPELAPEDWLRTIDEISAAASTSIVIGPSASGTTTFAKRLLNRYLTGYGKTAKPVPAVCYMDLDYSSPEYTPHGQISLTIVRELNFGPAYTHPTTFPSRSDSNETIASHVVPFQGLTNIEEYFTSCVEHLFQTYQNLRFDGPTPPLILNTNGELYMAHYDMLQKLVKNTKPNYIVHLGDKIRIDEEAASKLHDLQVLAQKTHSKLHELAAQFPANPLIKPSNELQAMHMQSYFHLTGQSTSRHPSFTSSPLTTLAPWEFCYKETPASTQDLIGILPLFEPLDASQLLTALNGSIVQIVTTTDTAATSQYTLLPRTPASEIPYFPIDARAGMAHPLRPSTTTYICTALIRGVDPSSHILQVLVPKSHEHLLHGLEPEKTVFVAGCCETPEWAYVEDAYQHVAQRRRNLGERARFASEEMLTQGLELPPWVAKKSVVNGMGHLNAVRRVRKFLG